MSHVFPRFVWRRRHVFASRSDWFVSLTALDGDWPEKLLWFCFYDTQALYKYYTTTIQINNSSIFHSRVQGHLEPTPQGNEPTDQTTSFDIGPGETQPTQRSPSRNIQLRKLALLRKLRNLKIEQ